MVRCGRCAQVFDGFKTLATLPEAPPEAAPTTATVPETSAPEPVVASEAVVEASPHAAPPSAVDDATFAQPAMAVEPPPSERPVFDPVPPRRRNVGWGIGVALMLCGLAAQAAYFYRSDIAASLPEARPQLNRMCELLHCTVALPQRPRQISIEASDMQAPDPANPGLVALTATLRSHATTALGYPALDVVLTNTKEHTVARRIFMPAEYLVAGKDPRAGIAPNAEVTIRLDLDTGDLGAAGFRLDLIAAPAR